ncbi:MAG: nucleotide exchange factor GrpE [Phycisphaerae bacterium]|nr:nucleotide exchange factor GrpE [Phycisphaerae bacterium]
MSEKDLTKADKKIAELEEQIKELNQQIDKLKAEKNETLEQLQRVSADYANYQKRIPRQIAESVLYEKKTFLRSLLPTIDNFERALSHGAASQSQQSLENFLQGIQLVFEHMLDALKTLGVKRIDAVGQPFDPALHEALMQRCEPDKPDNTILEVCQTGYLLGEQVLRPSKVIVNKFEEKDLPAPDVPQEEAETTDTESEV